MLEAEMCRAYEVARGEPRRPEEQLFVETSTASALPRRFAWRYGAWQRLCTQWVGEAAAVAFAPVGGTAGRGGRQGEPPGGDLRHRSLASARMLLGASRGGGAACDTVSPHCPDEHGIEAAFCRRPLRAAMIHGR